MALHSCFQSKVLFGCFCDILYAVVWKTSGNSSFFSSTESNLAASCILPFFYSPIQHCYIQTESLRQQLNVWLGISVWSSGLSCRTWSNSFIPLVPYMSHHQMHKLEESCAGFWSFSGCMDGFLKPAGRKSFFCVVPKQFDIAICPLEILYDLKSIGWIGCVEYWVMYAPHWSRSLRDWHSAQCVQIWWRTCRLIK